MGWSFHKSIKIGPFRINIGKTGIGFSVGAHGFRTGVRSNGSTYKSVSQAQESDILQGVKNLLAVIVGFLS